MKEYKDSIVFTLSVIVIIAIAIFCANFEHKQDEKTYNQGVCTLCGGQYIFSDSSHHSDLYYYTCDKCHHTITVHSIMR